MAVHACALCVVPFSVCFRVRDLSFQSPKRISEGPSPAVPRVSVSPLFVVHCDVSRAVDASPSPDLLGNGTALPHARPGTINYEPLV